MLVTVALTLVMTYAEAIGIALFYPLFETGETKNDAANAITGILDVFDISPTASAVLPLIVILFVAKGILQFVTLRYQFSLARTVTRRLRRRALDALGSADYEHVSSTNAGAYTSLVANDVLRVSGGFFYYTRALSPLVSAGGLFLMVCLLDWRLSLLCVGMGIVMVIFTRLTSSIVRRYSHVTAVEAGTLLSLLVQMLQGFKYLRSTGADRRFDGRVWATSERLLEADFKSQSANAFLTSMSQPIMVLFLGGLLYYRAVIQGGELASLFILLLYFFRIMNEIFTLQSAWQSFVGYVGSIALFEKVTQETERAAEPRGTEEFDGVDTAIKLESVSFAYRTGRKVLSDISLEIRANTTVAFVGESGAGKSTLVDLLMGTLRASQGRVLIGTQDLARIDLESLRRHIGYVPQDAALFDDTIEANIALWSDKYSTEQIRDAAERALCLEFIEQMPQRFQTQVGDRGVKLSGGQRQRLAIARELLRSPAILVLDEATSALDTESELAIQQSIERLRGKMTIVIIAHRLSTIRTCDRVFVLNEGKIVEDGRFDELAARPNGRFRRMVELQEVAP